MRRVSFRCGHGLLHMWEVEAEAKLERARPQREVDEKAGRGL